jgi:sugar phosphate permease
MTLMNGQPTRVRYGVMAFLCSLAFILYVDRVCIGQAGTKMMDELDISEDLFGYVLGAFQVSYAIFEIITGHWGDRYGSRRVLTRIVLWWSAFTALTGCVYYFSFEVGGIVLLNSFVVLLLTRFLFGAGEAGALPNAARVISQWFPPGQRSQPQSLISASAQIGFALAPPVAAYIIELANWRLAFLIFGSLGVIWAAFFWRWFRDNPADHPGVNAAELAYITAGGPAPVAHHPDIPWRQVFRSANIWLLGTISFCTSFYSYFLFGWLPTYLKDARQVPEVKSGWMTSVIAVLGACGVLLGGYTADRLSLWFGSRRLALRIIGSVGLLLAGILVGASLTADDPFVSVMFCGVGFFFAYIQLAAWWATMGDIGGRHLGALFGLCNMIGLAGGFVSQVGVGKFVREMKLHGYTPRAAWDPSFYVFGGLLLLGGVCWLFINAEKPVVRETHLTGG